MKYLLYELYNYQPIKMTAQNKSDSTEYTLDYVAGTAVRGAVINRYCATKKIDLSSDKDIKVNILKNLYFLNAYPVAEGRRTTPAPLGYMADKKALSEYDGSEVAIKNVLSDDYKFQNSDKSLNKEPFIIFSENEIKGKSVSKDFKLHTSVNGRGFGEEKKALFRYESICENQKFMGYIASEDEEIINEIKEIIDGEELYIGGSKGSGYGKSVIKYVDTISCEFDANVNIQENRFCVYFLSDSIIYDQNGFLIDHISENEIEKKLNIKNVRLISMASDSIRQTGYNNTWKLPMAQFECIKAGSLHEYSFEGELDMDLLSDFIDRGCGQKRQEGFGRFTLINIPEQTKWKRACEEKIEVTIPELSSNGLEMMEKVVPYLFSQKVDRLINKWVVDDSESIIIKLNQSQIGNFIEVVDRASLAGPEKGKSILVDYFGHMKEKKNNQKIIRQFEDTQINNISLLEFLETEIKNSSDVEVFLQKTSGITIGNVYRYVPNSQEVFKYNMEYLQRLFRYMLRKG